MLNLSAEQVIEQVNKQRSNAFIKVNGPFFYKETIAGYGTTPATVSVYYGYLNGQKIIIKPTSLSITESNEFPITVEFYRDLDVEIVTKEEFLQEFNKQISKIC